MTRNTGALCAMLAALLAAAPGRAAEVDKTIVVEGTEFKFSPAEITVQQGRTVRVEFHNAGKISHSFAIPALDVRSKTIQTGATDTVRFTAKEGGTYTFICTVPGHKEAGMRGEVVVQ